MSWLRTCATGAAIAIDKGTLQVARRWREPEGSIAQFGMAADGQRLWLLTDAGVTVLRDARTLE